MSKSTGKEIENIEDKRQSRATNRSNTLTSERRIWNNERKKYLSMSKRQSETDDQTDTRKKVQRIQKREWRRKQGQKRSERSQETLEMYKDRKSKNRDHMQSKRALRTSQEIDDESRSRKKRRRVFLPSEYSDQCDTVDFGQTRIECQNCRALHFMAERIVGSSVSNPKFAECCSKGKITMEEIGHLPSPPQILRELLEGETQRDKDFRANARMYNNALQMASVSANWTKRGPGSSSFHPTLEVNGCIHHYIGSLLPPKGHKPSFLSMYIYDTDISKQSQNRARNEPRVDPNLLEKLTEMLSDSNTYVKSFLSLREIAHSKNPAHDFRIVIHADKRPEQEHVRRYNGPACSEIAALIPGNESVLVGRRDIVVRRRGILNRNGNEVLHTISPSHRSYDPLSYPLLNPTGKDGWHPEMRFRVGDREHKLTPMMYYSWHMFQRRGEFSTILAGCRLFQQYVVDQYCKIESERLSYIMTHQQNLRAEDYTTLCEALGDAGSTQNESEAVRTGRLVVLPSTFVGGDRYMRQKMHDIIATSNKQGHPDIFLTMTCNPNWPEIRRALMPGQTPQDRPDLCARVFRLKLKALMEVVIQDEIFGKVAAHVEVIEFQKRGLPHVHCIFILREESKNALRNPANIDKIISAEIPGEDDSGLRTAVLQHMIHNPCGENNPDAVCLREGKCTKRFPKQFRNETEQSENEHYVGYRRRSPDEGGQRATRPVRGNPMQQVDNSWVVAHCPKLLRMFQCHMNVELCVSRVGGIKYLFKYICKGSDRVTLSIEPGQKEHNEVRMFQDARYVSASEAIWRILGFDIVNHKPSVVRLEVHTENHHTVYFRQGEERAAALRDSTTKLEAWFKANEMYPAARHIRYDEYPRYFTWVKKDRVWKPRESLKPRRSRNKASSSSNAPTVDYDFTGSGESVIGRVYTVSPREGERYYLRTLLFHVSGATSFNDMRTVDGEVCSSFREACSRHGLLADDAEWRRALQQSFKSSFVPLTQLFATIIAFCEPSDPKGLWEEHKSMFIADIQKRYYGRASALEDEQLAISYILFEIQESLQTMGSVTLSSIGLPEAPKDLPTLFDDRNEVQQTLEKLHKSVAESVQAFNEGQKAVFDAVMGAVVPGVTSRDIDAPTIDGGGQSAIYSRVFFLDAPGGTGKTFVIRAIHGLLRFRGKKVIAVATSAVAAVLLDDGRTAHSTFKIPIPCNAESTCSISASSQLAEELREVDLIIWDEIVMCHRYCIEAVDRSLRDIRRSPVPFGGVCVLFSGDFRQILPVIQGGSRAQIVNACVKTSSLYPRFTTLRLTENMRLANIRKDPKAENTLLQFPDYLLKLGEGRLECNEDDSVDLPDSVGVVNSVSELCETVFDGTEEDFRNPEWLTSRAILSTKNCRLEEINQRVGCKIRGPFNTFLSADKVEQDDESELRYPVEMLNTLTAGSALPDHRLQLKKGFIVMLLRNMCPEKGHVNGARYIVQHMTNNVLHLKIAVGAHAGRYLSLPRIPCSAGDENFPVRGFKRVQFPVRVCFGMTINKAQGQSFSGKLGLDLTDECFSHGQLYVGESRTTDPRNLTVCLKREDNRTKNVVYLEALS